MTNDPQEDDSLNPFPYRILWNMFFWQWVHNQSVNAVLKKKNMLYNLLVLQAAAPMSLCAVEESPPFWSWLWLRTIIIPSMCRPHRRPSLPRPEGYRGNKAPFITLPSPFCSHLPPTSLSALSCAKVVLMCKWVYWKPAPPTPPPRKETLSMKMQQSESTSIHTACHSSSLDRRRPL